MWCWKLVWCKIVLPFQRLGDSKGTRAIKGKKQNYIIFFLISLIHPGESCKYMVHSQRPLNNFIKISSLPWTKCQKHPSVQVRTNLNHVHVVPPFTYLACSGLPGHLFQNIFDRFLEFCFHLHCSPYLLKYVLKYNYVGNPLPPMAFTKLRSTIPSALRCFCLLSFSIFIKAAALEDSLAWKADLERRAGTLY